MSRTNFDQLLQAGCHFVFYPIDERGLPGQK